MKRTSQLMVAALGASMGLVGLSGCGQRDSTPTRDQLSQVAQSYEVAQATDDVTTACALMSPRMQQQVLAVGGQTDCPSLGQWHRLKTTRTDEMVESRVGESMLTIRRETKVDVQTTVTRQGTHAATLQTTSTVSYVGGNAKTLAFVFGGKRSQTKTATLTMKYENDSWVVDADTSMMSRY
ncbi:hypothetical protein [Nocardioides montaniterrae]